MAGRREQACGRPQGAIQVVLQGGFILFGDALHQRLGGAGRYPGVQPLPGLPEHGVYIRAFPVGLVEKNDHRQAELAQGLEEFFRLGEHAVHGANK